jgi:predicted amidophosphoribosyltransferase
MVVLRPALSRIADILFPATCALCREETGDARALCGQCWREVAFLESGGCTHCGRPLPGLTADEDEPCEECRRHPPTWDRGTAVFCYEGGGRKMILALKHADRQDLLPMLAGWAARKGRFLLERADVIAPVPLHWTRRLKRRTNQAADLARHLAGAGPAYVPRLLIRTRATGNQGGKDRAARTANVLGAFAPGPGAAIAGKRVLLVDDVMTTGATLSEAAHVCRAAGAHHVDVLVLALVMRDEHAYMRALNKDEDHEAG